ncbi:hypothetical protein MTR67_014075 [Solanum verrucosum]|uniref:Uncharacterized protein n=1 Tax=Solanum verrucosum TaxID=315347 RepID=A0AAF0QEA2_SOLVR|nr:hypothetical protein MTR67_014075 [Solanum verrucosum]
MLKAKRIKDLHSPDTQVCSLTLYSLWMPYIPIGVLEPFLLVLNPVKASAKLHGQPLLLQFGGGLVCLVVLQSSWGAPHSTVFPDFLNVLIGR